MKDHVFGSVWLHRLVQVAAVLALGATVLQVADIERNNNKDDDALRSGTTGLRRHAWSSTPHVRRPGFMKANKVVVFSLYGDRGMDRDGALANAAAVPLYYLSWRAIFVVDETIPGQFRDQLRDAGGTVIQLPRNYSDWGNAKRIFRFLVLADATVDFALFRDADSRISAREISSVNTWLQTNKTFHIMRDHPNHWFVLPGGMWGVHAARFRSKLGDIGGNLTRYVEERLPNPSWDTDQRWLEDVVWPLIGDDVVDHDAFHCGEHGNHSTAFPLPRDYHGDFVGLVQDTTAKEMLSNGNLALWPAYRQHGSATFWTTAPEKCRRQPHHIYG